MVPESCQSQDMLEFALHDPSLHRYDTEPLYPIQHLMTTFDLGGIRFYDLLSMHTVFVAIPQQCKMTIWRRRLE